jgi:predicted Zn-dependent protease
VIRVNPAKLFAICVLVVAWLLGSDALAHPELEWQIAELTRRIAGDPENTELYLQRGEIHRLHRDWPAAEADYRRARKLEPDLAAVDFLMGRMKLEADRPKEAKKLLDRFIAEEPGHALALVTRARVLVRLKKPLDAVRDYTKALAAYDDKHLPDPAFYLERARALVSVGDDRIAEALRGLDDGLQRLGQPITLQLYAIDLELRRGGHDAALERLERIAARADRKESWLIRRGEILEDAGRLDEARAAYVAALDAIGILSASRRHTRAVSRLQLRAEEGLERLDAAVADD